MPTLTDIDIQYYEEVVIVAVGDKVALKEGGIRNLFQDISLENV